MKARLISIWNSIKKMMTNNVGLKLLALLCSVILWLRVVNIDDPTQSRNFTATVTVKNEQVLTDAGKYYTLPEGNTVTFRVTARRKTIEALSGKDFKAVADMTQLEDERRVPIELKAKKNTSQLSISSRKHYLAVAVGENSESSFMVTGTTIGNPGVGFEVGKVTVMPNVVYVGGPADIVSTIKSAAATCDVTGKTEDFSESAVPKFYNEQGQEVDMASLTSSAVSVVMDVDMLSVQEVPIAVQTGGKLSDALQLDKVTTDPASIRVKGQPDVLNSLTTLTIPPDVINLSEIRDDFETTIDIQSYLPEGVSLVDGESTQVKIRVEVFSEDSREFSVKTSNLAIRFLEPGLRASFVNKKVPVKIRGFETALEELDESAIVGSVDASGLSEGKHTVAVTLDLDEGLVASTVTTELRIRSIEEPGINVEPPEPLGEAVEGESEKLSGSKKTGSEQTDSEQKDSAEENTHVETPILTEDPKLEEESVPEEPELVDTPDEDGD